MWKFLAIFILYIQHSAPFKHVREVSINCASTNENDKHIEYINCDLMELKSSKEKIRVSSNNLDMSAISSAKTINVDIVGHQNYPESFPDGLGTSINGTGSFTYKNTPLRFLRRRNFKEMSPQLFMIILEDNKIEELPVDTFYDLPNLNYLDLRKNRLASLPADLFVNSVKLTTLIVENNEISRFHPGMFRNCLDFSILYAEFNKIQVFQAELLKNCPKMQIISMRHNRIKNVPFDFNKFEELLVADFTNNAGTCDTMFFSFKPYDEYYDEQEQKKWIKTVPEFQEKIEEVCRG